jgi:PAS domain S-box-containing protein
MGKGNQLNLRDLNEETILRAILEGTAKETGGQFFASLVENLAKALNVHGASVTEYLEESKRLRALALWLDGEFVSGYEYDICGTRCEPVIEDTRLVHIPDNVMALYPADPDLPKVGAVSYMGVPLLDLDGKILGHLAVLDTRPMLDEPRNLALFQIFAARAAAELQRLRVEAEVREREEKLARLVDSAMDAIVELDHDLKVMLINPAAKKLFGCQTDRVSKQDFTRFLPVESRGKLTHLIKALDKLPEEQQYLWIPGGLKAINVNGNEFPAEATLSRFEMEHETFYTLILRNVDERLEAERKIRSLTVEAGYLKEEIKALQNFDEIIGQSEPMLEVLRDVRQVAETDVTVLILGETGTVQGQSTPPAGDVISRLSKSTARPYRQHSSRANFLDTNKAHL